MHSSTVRDDLFSANITHNLNKMAGEAGIYEALWRPDEQGWTTAADLIPRLQEGLAKLKADPAAFKAHNPMNGWGTYECLVSFVEEYLAACRLNPTTKVEVSR